MKRLMTALLLIVGVGALHGQTTVSGTILKDSTWTLAGSPYRVQSTVTVNAPFTLTVDSWVVVQIAENQVLLIRGQITARHAIFTSLSDTIGGVAEKGDWGQIQIGEWDAGGTATFDTCTFRYGGFPSPGDAALVFAYTGTTSLTGCDLSLSKNAGVMFGGGGVPVTLNVTGCSISSTDWPIRYREEGSLILSGTNNLTGNTHNAIYVTYSEQNGSVVLPRSPVPYVFSTHFHVRPGGMLQIASGNTLKFQEGTYLWIEGALQAAADLGDQILFTAATDDNAGGDTNADLGATTPASSYWEGIAFQDESVDSLCLLRRVQVRFAGANRKGGVSTYSASPTIDSCNFNNNWFGAMLQGVSNPVFSNNVIGSSQLVPIAMSFSANPTFTNNEFSLSDNRYDAIGLLGGELPANGNLPVRSVTTIPNVTYLLLEDVTVPFGRTLTIHERVVIKGLADWPYITVRPRITVRGKLVADASSDSTKIVFTSARDDLFGNPFDTNKDGTSSDPQREDWGGIVFEGTSDTTSLLNHCLIKYAAMPGTYYNTRWIGGGAVTMVNAAPTISNSEIKDVVHGVYAFQVSKPRLLNVTFGNSQYTPIAMSVSADPVLTGISYTGAGWHALGIIGEELGFNGSIRKRDVAGYLNITYVLLEDLTINSGTQVTVDPGVVVKGNSSGIFVKGGFRAEGTTAGGVIVFTSLKDDNYGNPQDTDGQGQSLTAERGDWKTIQFLGTSDDAFCLIDSCVLKYGGRSDGTWGIVGFKDAGGTLSNSTITDSYQFGVSCDGASTPTITGVDIRNCRLDPIAMSLTADPVFTNITFAANRSNGIYILEGTLSSNARLRRRDVAGYNNIAYIVDYLTIGQNAVLTIDPGVVIKFPAQWVWRSITVDGALVANGTTTQRIVFTSLRDDQSGGDTNNDGNESTPERGDWWAVIFSPTSNDTLNSLRNCDFRYGGAPTYWDPVYKNYGMLEVSSSRVLIDSCYFQQSSTSAIGIYGSADPTVTNCQISGADITPITMSMFANPSFADNAAYNVAYMALGIVPETYAVTASIPKRDFGGYTNITYLLMGGGYSIVSTVNSGTTLTIPEGVVFKGWPDNYGAPRFVVNGGLIINGTLADPVVFTDARDDGAGNPRDTNGDGFLSQPAVNGAPYIHFADVSDDSVSVLRYVDVRYHDVGISLQQASPTITHGRFVRDNWGIRLNGVSSPAVDSCAFDDLGLAPLYISLVSYPRSTLANTLSGSTYRAIGVVDETLAQDVTLPKRDFGGVLNIPYVFNQYTVGTGAIMTVQPGVVLKFRANGRFVVKKGLIAEGSSHPDSTIVFTDIRDDFYGGDTNADSSATTANDPTFWQNWHGILFDDESLDPLCRLRHAVVRYAGSYWTTERGGVVANSADPTITYSLIAYNRSGVVALGSSNPVVNYCDFVGNVDFGLQYPAPAFVIDARWNWWGSNTGPTHEDNPGGVGDKVSNSVNYTPFLTTGTANPVAGDVSLNGRVQAYDASLILKWVADSVGNPLNAVQLQVADVSGSSGVISYDAALILQYVVKKISVFPVEFNRQLAGTQERPLLAAVPAVSSLRISSTEAGRGERVTVVVEGAGMTNVFSSDIELAFDSKVLRAVSVEAAGAASKAMFEGRVREGTVRLHLASAEPLASTGALASIEFEVAEDVRGTVQSPISFRRVFLNELDLNAEAAAGEITVHGKPTSYALGQNYPNPFNPLTVISYQVPEDGVRVRLEIYDLTGRLVRVLVDEQQSAGEYRVTWEGLDNRGFRVSSGLYFYRLSSGSFVSVRKMMMLK